MLVGLHNLNVAFYFIFLVGFSDKRFIPWLFCQVPVLKRLKMCQWKKLRIKAHKYEAEFEIWESFGVMKYAGFCVFVLCFVLTGAHFEGDMIEEAVLVGN